ncbi:MAG: serine/threonine-protein kinase, partial [Acidobacteriota bacterium]
MTSAQGSTPETIGDFSVLGEIGRGTFGPIYRARRGDLDAVVTVCRTDDDGLRRRFEHRARDAARLEHERLAWILEVGTTADGAPFTARESLPGRTLAEALKSGLELDVRSRLDLLRQVAEGLAFVHDRGLVHRDLKPAHLQLLPTGQVKILDLGIGSLASEQSQLTQRGVTLGSAAYMPPEQVRGGEVDARGDLFSWGVLAYELLTSQRPFRGKTLSALVYQILYKAPKPLQQAWNPAPRELGAIVDRCLQKEPDDRYPDAHRLLDDLGGLLRGIDQGSYPALVSGAAPALLEGTLPGDEDDPLSRSMISRTAAAVDQDPAAAGEEADRQDGLLGSTSPSPAVEVAALSAGAAETVISRPPSTRGNRSTQPVSVGGLDTVAPESVEDEVTRPLPVDEARARHAASQQAAAESVNPVAFETDSRALQELVAQGNLGA